MIELCMETIELRKFIRKPITSFKTNDEFIRYSIIDIHDYTPNKYQKSYVILASHFENIIGFGYYTIFPDNIAKIDTFYSIKSSKRGVGSSLINSIIHQIEVEGIETVITRIECNEVARTQETKDFFMKRGFTYSIEDQNFFQLKTI